MIDSKLSFFNLDLENLILYWSVKRDSLPLTLPSFKLFRSRLDLHLWIKSLDLEFIFYTKYMFRFRVGSIIQAIPIILHFVRLFRQWRVIYIHKIELDSRFRSRSRSRFFCFVVFYYSYIVLPECINYKRSSDCPQVLGIHCGPMVTAQSCLVWGRHVFDH